MASMTDARKQVVTGLIPPQVDEAVIRIVWPSVAAFPRVAATGRILMRSIIGAPLGWLLLAPFYFLKVLPLPGLKRRYVLTNRRLMRQAGPRQRPAQEVALADIDDVRLSTDANTAFYRAAKLEIVSKDQVAMSLPGVPNPESFRQAILNACKAWVPGRAARDPFVPASASKKA